MRHYSIILLSLILLLFCSCKRNYPVDGAVESLQFYYVNDTDFDCAIDWRASESETFESISIASTEQYLQILPAMSVDLIMSDGKTCLDIAREISITFRKGNQEYNYNVTYEEGEQIRTGDCFWSRLPHYQHVAIHNPPEEFTSIRTNYLSDVLALAKEKEE